MYKVIGNEIEYEDAIIKLEKLMEHDPERGTSAADELELLALLIQEYESRRYKFSTPDPIEAINFRMEQQNLTPRDLIPYIGSRSKVSEILSGKRPLTISMIRALNSGLGIPANILIREPGQREEVEIDWARFPVKQMIEWGWIAVPEKQTALNFEEILKPFFATAETLQPQTILCRSSVSSSHIRSGRSMDLYALMAWSARVLSLASQNSISVQYKAGILTNEFLHEVARLSIHETGPLMARDFLTKYGIQVIIERHLPHTYLDGATILTDKTCPVIGLTLRYDRIDNFWFTLLHELAHLALHLNSENNIYFDDLDIEGEDDPREHEANQLAGEILIPQDVWIKSPASRLRSPVAAEHLAKQLQIHPAIVAGRMQHEFKAYQLLGNLIGHHQVRKLFTEVKWRENDV
jgi:HTH-type transcriptional regulator / antitoxin HigA